MSNIRTVFEFGWTYLRRYWGRLTAGILLGMLFGLTNASFVWATKTLFDRLKGPQETMQIAQALPTPPGTPVKRMTEIGRAVDRTIEPWLPRQGRPLDWRQI